MKYIFWIVAVLLLIAILLTRKCTPDRVQIVEKTVYSTPDTVYLEPDTVVVEKVITNIKTVTKVKEIPVVKEVQDTNVYEYATVNYFGDTIAVLDSISVAGNEIVEHKQRVVLMDNLTVREVKIEVPVLIRDTITVTKEITKELPAFFRPSAYAGLTYMNYNTSIVGETAFVPNAGFSFGKHYVGIGAITTLNRGLVGGIIEYKFRFRK